MSGPIIDHSMSTRIGVSERLMIWCPPSVPCGNQTIVAVI
jgi:hypothetical protein